MSEIEAFFSKDAHERRIVAIDGEGLDIALSPGVTSANPHVMEHGWHTYNLLLATIDDPANPGITGLPKYIPARQSDMKRREVFIDEDGHNRPDMRCIRCSRVKTEADLCGHEKRDKDCNVCRNAIACSRSIARNYGIRTKDALDFILGMPEDALIVGFAFSYDVNKILADMPLVNQRELNTDSVGDSGGKTVWRDYEISYTPRKQFQISRISSGKKFRLRQRGPHKDMVNDCEKCNRRKVKDGKKPLGCGMVWESDGYKHSRIVWDIFGFFQKAFVGALADFQKPYKKRGEISPFEVIWDKEKNRILSALRESGASAETFVAAEKGVIPFIQYMKDNRSDFDNLPIEQVIEYCRLECRFLAILMRDMLVNIQDAMELRMTRYDGAGAVASAWYTKKGTVNYKTPTNLPHDVALFGYFGGRFEVGDIGYIGDAYSYDINSAYPYLISTLPCIAHGHFEHVSVYDDSPRIAIWRVSSHTTGFKYAPFGFRSDKEYAREAQMPERSILYAHEGQRWAWQSEVKVARQHYGSDAIEIHEGYVWVSDCELHGCDGTPFKDVPEMYRMRKILKKAGDGAEKVFKLTLNSLYGKLAQSIGFKIIDQTSDYEYHYALIDPECDQCNALNGAHPCGISAPKYQSFIWAGLITSGTRAMILDAAMQNGADVVSFATDGILSRTPIDILKTGAELGDWEFTLVKELYIFQSGVYVYQKADDSTTKEEITPDWDRNDPRIIWKQDYKTRGFSQKEVPAEKLINAWENGHHGYRDDCEKCRECARLNKSNATLGCGLVVLPEPGSTRFIPMRLGLNRMFPTEFTGQWVDSTHAVAITHTRRIASHSVNGAATLVFDDESGLPEDPTGSVITSMPYSVKPIDILSEPYSPKQNWEDLLNNRGVQNVDSSEMEATEEDEDEIAENMDWKW
jgi:hypothetical protein